MEESLETQKVILYPWFDKVFIFVARYTSYTFTVSLCIHISTAPIKDDISILALELEPKWNYFLEIYNKGLSSLKNKNFTQALDLFSEAQKLIPNYHFIQFQLALIYYHLGKYEFAQEHILKYLEFQPNDQMGLKLAANIFTKSRKIEKAQEFIQKLNELGSQKDG
jgi:tetratricopeptide (TPR) repeat protein